MGCVRRYLTPRRDRPTGFRNNYEFVVQISVFGLADNLAYRRTLLCLSLYTPCRGG